MGGGGGEVQLVNLVSNFFTNNLNLNKKKKWGGGGCRGVVG